MCHPPTRTRTKGSAGQPAAIVFIAASLIAYGSTAFAQGSPGDVIKPGSPTHDLCALGWNDVAGTVTRSADEGPLHAALRRARLEQSPALTPQAQQRSSWVGQHPVIAGTLIGAAGGAALSRTRAVGGANHDPRVVLIGAGAGAWGGLVAGAVHKARAKEKITVGEKIGIAAGAIGIVVLPLLACYGAGGCGGVS